MIRQATCAWLLALALPSGAALAGEIVPVRLELLSAPSLHLQPGDVLESPIQVRVLRVSDGQPLEGVIVLFMVNVELCAPLLPCNLPRPGTYGGFLTTPGEPPSSARRVSNADGIAVSPDFQAGSVAGSYEIALLVSSLDGQNFSSYGTPRAAVQVVQGGNVSGPFLVPATEWQGQALLVALMLLLGGLMLRRLKG